MKGPSLVTSSPRFLRGSTSINHGPGHKNRWYPRRLRQRSGCLLCRPRGGERRRGATRQGQRGAPHKTLRGDPPSPRRAESRLSEDDRLIGRHLFQLEGLSEEFSSIFSSTCLTKGISPLFNCNLNALHFLKYFCIEVKPILNDFLYFATKRNLPCPNYSS